LFVDRAAVDRAVVDRAVVDRAVAIRAITPVIEALEPPSTPCRQPPLTSAVTQRSPTAVLGGGSCKSTRSSDR
jgi:hypothetical protein